MDIHTYIHTYIQGCLRIWNSQNVCIEWLPSAYLGYVDFWRLRWGNCWVPLIQTSTPVHGMELITVLFVDYKCMYVCMYVLATCSCCRQSSTARSISSSFFCTPNAALLEVLFMWLYVCKCTLRVRISLTSNLNLFDDDIFRMLSLTSDILAFNTW